MNPQPSSCGVRDVITRLGNTPKPSLFMEKLILAFSSFFGMPVFQCTKCGKKFRADFELSCTGDVKRNVEKPPECCGKPMIEIIDD
jgi:hypothetical protein